MDRRRKKTAKVLNYLLEKQTEKYILFYSNRAENTDIKIEKKDYGHSVDISSENDYVTINDDIIALNKELMLKEPL